MTLKVIRDGKEISLPLTLAARPTSQAMTSAQTTNRQGAGAWLGISGVTLSSDLAQAMDLGADQTGVLVENVTSGSPADEAGLKGSFKAFMSQGQRLMVGGDVITALNDQPVTSMEELASAIQAMSPGDTATLSILRNGEQMTVSVTLGARPTQTP